VHYVVLLVGFYIAIAALGADMTKFAILAVHSVSASASAAKRLQ